MTLYYKPDDPTRIWQVLTNIDTMETVNAAKMKQRTGRSAIETLLRSLEDLRLVIKSSEVKVSKCEEEVKLQQKKILLLKGNAGGGKEGSKPYSLKLEYQLQKKLKLAQIELEMARVNPVIASRRVAVAQDTLALLLSLVDVKKSYSNLENSLAAKSKARLHSQVVLFLISIYIPHVAQNK